MAPLDGDIYKVVTSITMPSLVIAQNVYYWRLDDSVPNNPTNIQIVAAIDAKITDMYTDIASQMSDEVDVGDTEVDKVEWNAVDEYWETVESLGSTVTTVNGTNVDDAMPHGVALTVTADTSWPKTRARKFYPGIAEGAAEDSVWDGATLTAIALLIAEWLQDKTVAGSAVLVPVVASVAGAKAGLALALLQAGASAVAGYQRRRKPGVGS